MYRLKNIKTEANHQIRKDSKDFSDLCIAISSQICVLQLDKQIL